MLRKKYWWGTGIIISIKVNGPKQHNNMIAGEINLCLTFTRAGVLYRNLKYKEITECFKSDKARTVSFFRCLLR